MNALWARLERRPWRSIAGGVATGMIVAVVIVVVGPWFVDTSLYGFHDWDTSSAFRELAVKSLLEHGEWPSFNPYHCGGYPLWGYVEGATNVVSPWLPVYLVAPLSLALRVEVFGMGIVGAAGAYALAARYTPSHAARLLVVAVWAVNGRWGLQVAAGHTWHLAYAYVPWCLFWLDRACGRRGRARDVLAGAVCFAMLVYAGGIYPLPHASLAAGLFASGLALTRRRARPLVALAVMALFAVGLAAPKLLPMLHTFGRDPRHIASTERLDLGAFVTLLTHPKQPFRGRPAAVTPYGWHEWGMYISGAGAALVAFGMAIARGRRVAVLRLVGLAFVVLGFGAFHPFAPWVLLHRHVPPFGSQHVPSRFLYPAVLLCATVAAAGLGRVIWRLRHRAPWLDLAATLLVAALAFDVAKVARQPMLEAMWMRAPTIAPGAAFQHVRRARVHYERRDWAAPMLLAVRANTGVLDCYGVPRGRDLGPVVPAGDPQHRGLAFFEGGERVQVARWSPAEVATRFEPGAASRTLVYNMRYWRGWSSDVGAVQEHGGRVAVTVPAGVSAATLRYTPPGLAMGGGVCVVTLLLALAWRRRAREAGSW